MVPPASGTSAAGSACSDAKSTASRRGSLSLPVVTASGEQGTGSKIRRSRNGPRRAAVLILIHIIFAIHIGLWLATGMRTVTPIEPSESMYTLEQGLINAGFIFFVLALVSTLIFGRFFCGWACHIVALQDLCSWLMKRCGIHPRPFRSRLLIYIPLGLALYMFVWPTFQRTILQPMMGERWSALAPYLGYYPPRPEFVSHLTTTDFWATFPPWYIAIPFLLVCGFGVVYFMGSKGFCTYGCPYGGFFAPLDRISPGRILVSDACNGCGHCTAVCSSNVRTHEEVRDFGMVVDSGCMKCLDCVSVCPNEALRFGFAVPPIFRSAAGPKGGSRRPRTRWLRRRRDIRYDLTWPEELAAAGTFFILLIAYRGMLNSIPLLMAVGMAAIGTFLLWKSWRLVRDQNVRIQNVQLKFKGRLQFMGAAYAFIALFILISGAWGAIVKYNFYVGDVYDTRITTPFQVVFAAQYSPDPEDRALALRAANHLERAGPWSEGGIGWEWSPDRRRRLAWLLAVAGEDERAIHHLRAAIHAAVHHDDGPAIEQVGALATLITRSAGTSGDGGYQRLADELRAILALRPDLAAIRIGLATLEFDAGRKQIAAAEARLAAERQPHDSQILLAAAGILLETGDAAGAADLVKEAVALNPGSAEAHAQLAIVLVMAGRHEEALVELAVAHELEPNNASHMRMMAQVLHALGRHAEATQWHERANRSDPVPALPGPAR